MSERQQDFTSLIGTCHTCAVDPCPTPKRRKLLPMEGCTDWNAPDVKAIKDYERIVAEKE